MRRKTTPSTSAAASTAAGADPGERNLKLQLAIEVNRALQQLRLTQEQAAARLGILQPHVSELAHLRLERFSAERLMQFLAQLGHEVEIRIHQGPARSPRLAARRIFVR